MKQLLLLAAFLATYFHASAFLTQTGWRWRNDDGTETSATWKAAQNSAITITGYNNIRLRVGVKNNQGNSINLEKSIQFSKSPNGPWNNIPIRSDEFAFALVGTNSFVNENQSTTQQLTGATGTILPGQVTLLSELQIDSLIPGTYKEYEWVIKPTTHIEANTTYYFKISSLDYSGSTLASLTTNASFPALAKRLSNGGFEDGLNGWTISLTNGGVATLTAAEDSSYDLSKALAVTVTNKGTTANAVQITHAPIQLSDSIYMIRFWAKAKKYKKNPALLDVDGPGIGGPAISFKLFPHWMQYQYAFKTTASSFSPSFIFKTTTDYVIENVEIIDQSNTVINVPLTYTWQNNHNGYGWMGADNDNSIGLPDGRTIWMMNDTYTGTPAPFTNIRPANGFIRNCMVLQDGVNHDQLHTIMGDTDSPVTLWIPPPAQYPNNWYWPTGAVIENNKLKVLLAEWWVANNVSEYAQRMVVASYSLPGLQFEGYTDIPLATTTLYECPSDGGDGYYYVMGNNKIGRFPYGSIANFSAWRFYSNGNWIADYNAATEIADIPSQFVKLGPGNYAGITAPGLSLNVEAVFAQSPSGPWTNKRIIYQRPEEWSINSYCGRIHPEQNKDGKYTISYSVISFGDEGSITIDDKGTYIPYYIQADLKALSPFAAADPVVSFSALPVNMQVFPRNLKTNNGTAKVEGVVKNGNTYKSITVRQYRENVFKKDFTKQLSYTNDSAVFKINIPLKAELANNKLEVYGVLADNSMQLITTVDSLLAGDALIIQGQSNAEATKYLGSANTDNQSNFIRVWGAAGQDDYTRKWFIGNGDVGGVGKNDGNTGQWGLHLAKKLIDSEHIPVVIFNGAHGGKPVAYFEKTYNNGNNNYNNLLDRVTESGFINSIQAICWFQGESDSNPGNSVQVYKDSFNVLYNSWKADYKGFKKLYIIQTKQSCNSDAQAAAIIAEAHRQLVFEIPNASILSTQGIEHLNSGFWCHYAYENGYKIIGDYMFLLINRDIRNLVNARNVESPQVTSVSQTASNKLTLYFKNAADTYVWEAGTEADFVIHGVNATVTSGEINGASVVLTLNKNINVDTLSFYGHMIGGSPTIKNTNGVGIVCFYKMLVGHAAVAANQSNVVTKAASVYPNPVKDRLLLNYSVSSACMVNISIADIAGKMVLQLPAAQKAQGSYQASINVSGLAKGMYVIKIQSGTSLTTVKFVKD